MEGPVIWYLLECGHWCEWDGVRARGRNDYADCSRHGAERILEVVTSADNNYSVK